MVNTVNTSRQLRRNKPKSYRIRNISLSYPNTCYAGLNVSEGTYAKGVTNQQSCWEVEELQKMNITGMKPNHWGPTPEGMLVLSSVPAEEQLHEQALMLCYAFSLQAQSDKDQEALAKTSEIWAQIWASFLVDCLRHFLSVTYS